MAESSTPGPPVGATPCHFCNQQTATKSRREKTANGYRVRALCADCASVWDARLPVGATDSPDEHKPSDPNCVRHRRELDAGRTCRVCARYDNATWLTQRECFEAGCL